MTILRLELSAAAALVVKVDEIVSSELSVDLGKSVYWTYGTVVLLYVSNADKRFQTFVTNRIAMIQNRSNPLQWRYVPTSRTQPFSPLEDRKQKT